MRRSARIVAAGAALMMALAACGSGDEETATLEIRLGALLPLTGALSDFGPAMARGVQLAVDVFKEAATAAGQNYNVEVFVEDSQTDAQAGVEGARKLVDTNKVQAIVGAAASSVTIAASESVAIPNKVLMISPASTSGDITKLKDDGFVNRTPPSDEHQAPILADAVAAAFGNDATINVGARNDAYGNFLIDGVIAEVKKLGVKIGKKTLWNPEAATFDSEAAQIVSGSPDGWVLVDFPGTWQKMGPALVRTGKWDPAKTFSADGLKTSKLPQPPPTGSGPETANGMRGTAPGGTEAFNTLWADRVKDLSRETFDSHSFDAAMIALLSAVAANSTDTTAMKNKLRDVSGPGGTQYTFQQLEQAIRDLVDGKDIDYEGASGPINLDENGDPQSQGAFYDVWEFKDAKLVVTKVEKVG